MPIDDTERERRRYALLWGVRKRGTRGRKPTFALEDVVRAAIAIADAEGLESVSMNRVASAVGSAVMSLYRYLPGKDELVDLMVEAVLAEKTYPARPPKSWRARLEIAARQEWQMFGRHPWVLQIVASMRLPMGPNMVRDLEWMLGAVESLTPKAELRLSLVMLVMAFVQGAGLLLTGERNAARRGDASVEEFWTSREPEFGASLDASSASKVRDMVSSMKGPIDLEKWFEFGLARTLDGIADLAKPSR